jgi:chromosome segregation ATPase
MKFNIFSTNKAIAEEKKKIEAFEEKIAERLDVAIVKDQEIERLKSEKDKEIEKLQEENQRLDVKITALERQMFEEKKKKHQQIQTVVEDRADVIDKLKEVEAEKQELDKRLTALEDEKKGLDRKLAETEKLHSKALEELADLGKEKEEIEKEKKILMGDLEAAKQKAQQDI